MAGLQPCEITLDKTVHVGAFPRMPMRFLLRRAYQEALGYTEADRALMAELEPGEPIPDPSEEGDGYAVGCVLIAVVGMCWPTRLDCPTIRECRHDVVAYGEGVFEALMELHQGAEGLGQQLHDEGRRLLQEMGRRGGSELAEAIEQERDFTEGPRENSTAG